MEFLDFFGILGLCLVICSFLTKDEKHLAILNGSGSLILSIYAFLTNTLLFGILEGLTVITVIYYGVRKSKQRT